MKNRQKVKKLILNKQINWFNKNEIKMVNLIKIAEKKVMSHQYSAALRSHSYHHPAALTYSAIHLMPFHQIRNLKQFNATQQYIM